MKRLPIILLCSVCLSCINTSKKTDQVAATQSLPVDSIYRIDLEYIVSHEQITAINDVAQEVRYIELDFERQSALSVINFRIDKLQDKLIASSFNTHVMQFDTLGRYEKSIIKFGRARNELRKANYKSTFGSGQLTFNQGYKALVATADAVDGYTLDNYYFSIVPLGNDGYAALPNLGDELTNDNLLDFLNSDFEYLSSVKTASVAELYYEIPQSFNGRLETFSLSSSESGEVLFRKIFSDTVYLVTSSERMEPYIKLEYGKLMPEVKKITNQDKIHIKYIAENQDYIFINYGYQSSMYSVIWDKTLREVVVNSKIDYSDNNTLINSNYFADYITPKGERIKVGIVGISNTTLYCVIKTEDAIEFMDEMSLEDNPLVMEIKLK